MDGGPLVDNQSASRAQFETLGRKIVDRYRSSNSDLADESEPSRKRSVPHAADHVESDESDDDDDDDDEEQSLESWLNPVESDKDYKKVPVELLETINRICQEKSIQYPAVIQAAEYYGHILVTGQKVESIQLQLAAAVASKFPDFRIFTQNRDGPLLAKQMVREDAVVVEQMSCSPSTEHEAEFLYEREWISHNRALCDLFVHTRVDNRSQVYAVAPGHMNFLPPERELAAGSSQDVRDWRQKVEAITTTKRFVISNPRQPTYLSHPPLLHYRHWYIDQSRSGQFCPQNRCTLHNSKQLCPHMCMNDIALLWIDVAEAERIRDENKNLKYGSWLQQIKRREDLERLTKEAQKIRVGEMVGKTKEPPSVTGPQNEKFGLHLTFVLTSVDCEGHPHRLESGDCGSIVSLLSKNNKCKPVGMFVGEYHGNAEFSSVPIYQAIILDQALKDIEIDYPHHVEHLTIFRPEDGARPPGVR